MKSIKWTDEERRTIQKYGEVCYAVAETAMIRSGINFDDIEQINQHFETHRWGSDTDRKYRARAIKKAIAKVAENAAEYL